MNTTAPDTQRRKHAALIALLGASLALGLVDAAFGLPASDSSLRFGLTVLGNVALLLIGFRWLQLDAHELDIRRPMWLTVCIVLFAAVFVPYYLYKTRPAGHRLQAIAAFFGLVFACMVATAIGAALMTSFGGVAATT